jgi:hypothetical protein
VSASSGWDYGQPTVPGTDRPRDSSEPFGFDLGISPAYEQPPTTVSLPAAADAPASLPSSEATTGFVLSLVGLAATPFLPIFTFAFVVSGLVISTSSLRDCDRGVAAGRGRAIAGVILGILGVVATLVVILGLMSWSSAVSPS